MENKNKEAKQVENVEEENAERPFRCKGSFRLGTACGECVRCQARNFGPEEKKAAIEAEHERTKHFPANRVKTGQTIRIENPEVIIEGVEQKKPE